MANPFSRTCRSLTSDAAGYSWCVWGGVLVMLLAWLAWLLLAKVTVYEVSQSARLEVAQASHPVTAQLDGVVLASSIQLGRQVAAGTVLVELDARAQRLRLAEQMARLESIPPQIAALKGQLASEAQAARRARAAADRAIEQARSRHEETRATADFAQEQLQRLSQLSAAGRVAQIELVRARAEAQRTRSAAEAMSLEVERLAADTAARDEEKRAALQSLHKQIADLTGQQEFASATVARLQQELDRHLIRAPVSGRIGEAATLQIGGFVAQGGVVASIVPPGDLQVVAEFLPAQALGRVLPGQSARMRLDGFPWAQFGTLTLSVQRVASEVRDGHVRVELLVDARTNPRLLRHGLPGAVEVQIERTTPAMLALRAAGQGLVVSLPRNEPVNGLAP